MTDDIVTRLRRQNKQWLSEGDLYENNWQLWNEAADEIERLRAALTECETTISRLKIEVQNGL